jgi:hypothetical protein
LSGRSIDDAEPVQPRQELHRLGLGQRIAREHNPLLFDLVLRRRLRDGSARFPAAVFDTRRHVPQRPATVAAEASEPRKPSA